MRYPLLLLSLLCAVTVRAQSEQTLRLDLSETFFQKIRAQGVPEHGLRKIFGELQKHVGAEYIQDTYVCDGQDSASVRPCDEEKRIKSTKTLILRPHPYAAVVDFARPSTEKRFFLINMVSGTVESFMASHGRGSGESAVAYKFSNTKDSKQTSLGLYMTGEVYTGGYGATLRMYGLEKSNDQAYNRDIVLHGAYYAAPDFVTETNPKTGGPWNRLGLSWGCPAVALGIAKRIIPLLKGGALMYHDHKDLAEEALSGREVSGTAPTPEDVPVPKPRPADLK